MEVLCAAFDGKRFAMNQVSGLSCVRKRSKRAEIMHSLILFALCIIRMISVFLFKKRKKTEECWCRIVNRAKSCILCILLNETPQSLGVQKTDILPLRMAESDEGDFCFVDLDACVKRHTDLDILRNAIADYHEQKTAAQHAHILTLLKDSRL